MQTDNMNHKVLTNLPNTFNESCGFELEKIINNAFMGKLSDRDLGILISDCFSDFFARQVVDDFKALACLKQLISDELLGRYYFGDTDEYIDLFNRALSLKLVLTRTEAWFIDFILEIDQLFVIGDLSSVLASITAVNLQHSVLTNTEVGNLLNEIEMLTISVFDGAAISLSEGIVDFFSL